MNEDIQGRPAQRDLPQSQVTPYAHTPPPPQIRPEVLEGCLLNQMESGGQRPHMGTVVRQVLSPGFRPSGLRSYPATEEMQILQGHQ